MPSEKLRLILQAKSPFDAEQIAAMPDADGWRWVYEHRTITKPKASAVCFTGFSAFDHDHAASLAEAVNLRVVGTVNRSLLFVCAGDSPGPAKLAKARDNGIPVLSFEAFLEFLETGVVPQISGL